MKENYFTECTEDRTQGNTEIIITKGKLYSYMNMEEQVNMIYFNKKQLLMNKHFSCTL